MSLWDQVRTNMSEWYAVAADKTEEMARVGVRKYDKFTISRDIERAFTDLGSHVYAAVRDGRSDFAHDAAVHAIVERIRRLEVQLEQKEREIQDIRGQARPWPAPVALGETGPVAATGGGSAGAVRPALPADAAAAPSRPAPDEPDEADIEASIDPRAAAAQPSGQEPWDDEIALWNEPVELDEEATGDGTRPRDGQRRTD